MQQFEDLPEFQSVVSDASHDDGGPISATVGEVMQGYNLPPDMAYDDQGAAKDRFPLNGGQVIHDNDRDLSMWLGVVRAEG
ncbi:hypothetical protein [Gordonia sp. NPDC003376]